MRVAGRERSTQTGLGGRRRFLKDLKLSAGELGRLSSPSASPTSLLTSVPGLMHLGNDFEVQKYAILDQKYHKV